MVRLTKAQAETLTALASLTSVEAQNWFQTELILRERTKGKSINHKAMFKAIERLLDKLHNHVPKLVDRRLVSTGYSWCLTPAGRALAETQLGVRT